MWPSVVSGDRRSFELQRQHDHHELVGRCVDLGRTRRPPRWRLSLPHRLLLALARTMAPGCVPGQRLALDRAPGAPSHVLAFRLLGAGARVSHALASRILDDAARRIGGHCRMHNASKANADAGVSLRSYGYADSSMAAFGQGAQRRSSRDCAMVVSVGVNGGRGIPARAARRIVRPGDTPTTIRRA